MSLRPRGQTIFLGEGGQLLAKQSFWGGAIAPPRCLGYRTNFPSESLASSGNIYRSLPKNGAFDKISTKQVIMVLLYVKVASTFYILYYQECCVVQSSRSHLQCLKALSNCDLTPCRPYGVFSRFSTYARPRRRYQSTLLHNEQQVHWEQSNAKRIERNLGTQESPSRKMVDPSLASRMDRMSVSEHGYSRSYTPQNRQTSHHNVNSGLNGSNHGLNGSNHGVNGSNHGLHNNNSLGGSSHPSRGGYSRNKSFIKPKLASSNSGYDPLGANSNHSCSSTRSFQHSYKKPVMPGKHQYLAMDCEMVGTVLGESVAARVVLIDWKGKTVLDMYMKPDDSVADYRTYVSGITEENLADAPTFAETVQTVQEMLHDKILVGHGVDNDLRALRMTHPWLMTRDTAYYQPFMRLLETSTTHNAAMSQNGATAATVWGPRKLKELAKEKLQRDIQVAGVSHCPVEDAAAALDLYKSHRPRWEACMSTEEKQQQQHALQMAAAQAAYEASMMSSSVDCHGRMSTFTPGLAPTRSTLTSSTAASTDDLSMSVHSYFHYSGVGTSRFQSGLDGSSHVAASNSASMALHTGFQPAAQPLDARSFHESSHSHHHPSLDHRPYLGPISRPVHRSLSTTEYHSNDPPRARPDLHRGLSLGFEAVLYDQHSFNSGSSGGFHTNHYYAGGNGELNTAGY